MTEEKKEKIEGKVNEVVAILALETSELLADVCPEAELDPSRLSRFLDYMRTVIRKRFVEVVD